MQKWLMHTWYIDVPFLVITKKRRKMRHTRHKSAANMSAEDYALLLTPHRCSPRSTPCLLFISEKSNTRLLSFSRPVIAHPSELSLARLVYDRLPTRNGCPAARGMASAGVCVCCVCGTTFLTARYKRKYRESLTSDFFVTSPKKLNYIRTFSCVDSLVS